MEYHLNFLPKSEIEIRVTIPFPEFEPHVKKAAILISEEIDIEGFRKGKAAYDVVKNRVGENMVYERAAELAVRGTYPKILEMLMANSQLPMANPPIGQPEITVTKLAPGNEFEYKVKTTVLPAVALPDYKEIAAAAVKERKITEVSGDEVIDVIDRIRESRTELMTVDRPAALGDRVEIDLGIRHGGVTIEGWGSKNHSVILGTGKFMPGVEDALVGMRTGEEKTFTLSVPETWRDTTYAGKELAVTAVMKLVQERKIPELTDEFAQGLGSFASAEAFKKNVEESISREKENKERGRIRGLIIEHIAKGAVIEVPDILIERELDIMLGEMKIGIEGMGMKWEEYVLNLKKTPLQFRQEWREDSIRRVRAALCLREIAKREDIEPTEEEIKAKADGYLSAYERSPQKERALDPDDLMEYTKEALRNQKVFEFLEKSETV